MLIRAYRKRIDSQVHESVYRVDTPEPDMIAAANLLSAVDMWTLGIPQEASTDQVRSIFSGFEVLCSSSNRLKHYHAALETVSSCA